MAPAKTKERLGVTVLRRDQKFLYPGRKKRMGKSGGRNGGMTSGTWIKYAEIIPIHGIQGSIGRTGFVPKYGSSPDTSSGGKSICQGRGVPDTCLHPYRFPARISSVESAGTDRSRLQGESGFSLGISFMVAGFRVTDGVFHSGLGTTGCFTYPGTSGVEGQGSQ